MEILTVEVNFVVNGIPVVVLIVADDFLKCCTDVVSITVGSAKRKTIKINYIILTLNCKVKTITTITYGYIKRWDVWERLISERWRNQIITGY